MSTRFSFLSHPSTWLAAVLALALIGCSGSGSGGGGSSGTTTVSGFVSKAPLTGASCTIYNTSNAAVGTAATSSSGTITWAPTTAVGAVYAQCTGGTYLDEATGTTVTNSTTLTGAVVITAGNAVTIVITPLTQLAWTLSGNDATKMVASAKTIAEAFGYPNLDILKTIPTDLNSAAAGTDDAGNYGTLLAAIAQMQKDQSQTLSALLTTLSGAISKNASDVGQIAVATRNKLVTALNNLASSAQNNNAAVRTNSAATRSGAVTALGGFKALFPATGVTSSQCYITADASTLGACASKTTTLIPTVQDGDAPAPSNPMSFSMVGSYAKTECVKDDNTGLVWEGKPPGSTASTRQSGAVFRNEGAGTLGSTASTPTTAPDYVTYVNNLSLCGYADWRMPTARELQGIVNYGAAISPRIDATWFPNTLIGVYWSSDVNAASATSAWYVYFDVGTVGFNDRDYSYYVRLVRASQ